MPNQKLMAKNLIKLRWMAESWTRFRVLNISKTTNTAELKNCFWSWRRPSALRTHLKTRKRAPKKITRDLILVRQVRHQSTKRRTWTFLPWMTQIKWRWAISMLPWTNRMLKTKSLIITIDSVFITISSDDRKNLLKMDKDYENVIKLS